MGSKVYNVPIISMQRGGERFCCMIDCSELPTESTLCGLSVTGLKNGAEPTGSVPRYGTIEDVTCEACKRKIRFVEKMLKGEKIR